MKINSFVAYSFPSIQCKSELYMIEHSLHKVCTVHIELKLMSVCIILVEHLLMDPNSLYDTNL